MIAHVPAAYVPNARDALIIGGGDGGTAKQLLRRPSLVNLTVVELDEELGEVSCGALISLPVVVACVMLLPLRRTGDLVELDIRSLDCPDVEKRRPQTTGSDNNMLG